MKKRETSNDSLFRSKTITFALTTFLFFTCSTDSTLESIYITAAGRSTAITTFFNQKYTIDEDLRTAADLTHIFQY